MSKKSVLIMIDQATRDAFSQLLVVYYLRWKGVQVYVCNGATLRAMCERYRPHVVFASWLGGGRMSYLHHIQHKTHIVLVDQEGGRLGEKAFKRSFNRVNDDKGGLARACSKVFTWGDAQAQWLLELGILNEDQIVVTGCPRLDPYLVRESLSSSKRKYIGVTLRGDAVTSLPTKFMENIFLYAAADPKDWISVGYPVQAHHESSKARRRKKKD